MSPFVPLIVTAILSNGCVLSQTSQSKLNSSDEDSPSLGKKEKLALNERRQSVAALKQWTVVGRMSIQTADDAWTGKLEWQQFPLNYQIVLNTPTGQGTIKIRGDDDNVVLETSKGHALIGDDEESLLYDQLGWDLPLNKLRQWILGTTELNQLSKATFDNSGNIHQLFYPGWEVKYLRFQNVESYLLPKKLFVIGQKLKLRLVIDKWILHRLSSQAVLKRSDRSLLSFGIGNIETI